jgi:hypothetical protein
LLVETENAFFAGDTSLGVEWTARIFCALCENAVGDIDTTSGDDGTGVTSTDWSAPANLGTALGELVEDAAFAPDTVALWPKPLGPIIGPNKRGKSE